MSTAPAPRFFHVLLCKPVRSDRAADPHHDHGRPRMIMMTVEEFVRLKNESGEPVPPELHRKRTAVRHIPAVDPLGYDTTDLKACALAMAENLAFVKAEIERFEKRVRRRR